MPVTHEPGRSQVDRDAKQRHQDHRPRRDFGRCVEAPDRFPGKGAREGDQQHRVGEGGEQGGAAPAVGVAIGRHPAGQHRGAPGQPEAQHVAEVVQRVRQQCQRVGGKAVPRLDDGERQVDEGHRGECAGALTVVVGVHGRDAVTPCARTLFRRPRRCGCPCAPPAQLRPCTSVPICSPRRMRSSSPGWLMSKMRSGRSLSRARANAAVSITCRLRARTSS